MAVKSFWFARFCVRLGFFQVAKNIMPIIPDRLPRSASKGEVRTFDLLKKLPESYWIYYEADIAGRYPDFIVLGPDFGLLVIEVKGWYPKNLQGGDSHTLLVNQGGANERQAHPLRQAREYQWRIVEHLKQLPNAAILLNENGQYQGRFTFPFGHLVILSNIETAQLAEHQQGDLRPLFPEKRVWGREKLLAAEHWDAEALIAALQAVFDPYFAFPPLTAPQMALLRAALHPEIILTPPAYVEDSCASALMVTPVLPSGEVPALKVLDAEQEAAARSLGDGHRLIFGVPGSGKTVLLLAKARLLSAEYPEGEILLLCYNVALATYLAHAVGDLPNVKALHFDGWAAGLGVRREENESSEDLGERLLEKLERPDHDLYYQAILVDEAQDFAASWFRCLLAVLVDGADGDLLLVGDGKQSLYRQRPFTWRSLGIQAQGRSKILRDNYRNRESIVALAAHLSSFLEDESEGSEFGNTMISLDSVRRAGGFIPLWQQSDSMLVTQELIIRQVQDWRDGRFQGQSLARKVPAEEIAILYPYLQKAWRGEFARLIQALQQIVPVVWLSENAEARRKIREPGLKVQTMKSAKGLQYPYVIVLWPDLYPSSFDNSDWQSELRELYAAITRAEEGLLLITQAREPKWLVTAAKKGLVERA
jgi:hypothetical protein